MISGCLGVSCGGGSNLISDAFCMVGFKADLSIDEEITKLMKSISINIRDIQQKNLYVYFFQI